jgi:membrane protein
MNTGADPVQPPNPTQPWRRFAAVLAVATPRWLAPRTSLFAAALAFHALLALAPVLLVLLSVADRLLGQEAARRSLAEAAVRFAGPGADQVVSALLGLVAASRWRTTGTVLGVALLLYFASSFVAQLRIALDAVWEVRRKSLRRALFDRVLSFGDTLLALAAALLVLAVGVLRSIAWPVLARSGPTGAVAWTVWTRLGTLLMTSAVLAAAFRYLPYVRPRPRLRAVLAGALPAAVTLHLGSEAFGLVISRSAVASLYGTAGSVIMFLLWVHYSAWIVLFGAEVCRAWDEPAPAAGPAPRNRAPE